MLSFKLVAKVAFLASLASCSPLAYTRRTDSANSEVVKVASKDAASDIGILNFALTLEHLEHQFYVESLHLLGEQDFRRANIPNPTQAFQNFHHILQHEAQHVKTLQTVITSLGGTPLPPCEYNFGVKDVHGFMALARILEKVGVSAYDGAVALLNNPDLQTAAATIDTVEARHASFILTATGGDPFPENFDVALSGNQIVTLAASVIKSCPFDIKTTLGAAPAGGLSLLAPHVVRAGREIKLKFDPGHNKPEDHFCSFIFSDKSVISSVTSDFKCKVPKECRGDIFVAVLNKNEPLNLKNSVALIVAGPIILSVDSTIEDSCKEFVHGVDFDWKGYNIDNDKDYNVDVEKGYKDDWYKPKDDAYKRKDYKADDNKPKDHPKDDSYKPKDQETDAYKPKDYPVVEMPKEADAYKPKDEPKKELPLAIPPSAPGGLKDQPKADAPKPKDEPKKELPLAIPRPAPGGSKDQPKAELPLAIPPLPPALAGPKDSSVDDAVNSLRSEVARTLAGQKPLESLPQALPTPTSLPPPKA